MTWLLCIELLQLNSIFDISLAKASASLNCLRLVAVYGSIGVSLIQGFVITHEFIPSPEVILYPNVLRKESALGKLISKTSQQNHHFI